MASIPKVSTCLWFDGQAEEAATFYVSLLPNSRITQVTRLAPGAPALLVEFTLDGTPFQALNGGPQFRHSEAASISVRTRDQAETDRLWDALIANGGSESQCAWLNSPLKNSFGAATAPFGPPLRCQNSTKHHFACVLAPRCGPKFARPTLEALPQRTVKDRFSVSWQIVPEALPRLLGADDRSAAARAMQAMLGMSKIDIAALEAAFRGEPATTRKHRDGGSRS